MTARPVRRSHFSGHHACQPVALVVRLNGLCPAVRPASDRPRRYPVRKCQLRDHPAQAAQDRRARHHQRPTRQDRYGIGLPMAPRMGERPCLPCRGRATLTNQTVHSPISLAPTNSPPRERSASSGRHRKYHARAPHHFNYTEDARRPTRRTTIKGPCEKSGLAAMYLRCWNRRNSLREGSQS